MPQAFVLYTTGVMLSCPACDYPVDNLPLYAGYWPVRLAPVAAPPPSRKQRGRLLLHLNRHRHHTAHCHEPHPPTPVTDTARRPEKNKNCANY